MRRVMQEFADRLARAPVYHAPCRWIEMKHRVQLVKSAIHGHQTGLKFLRYYFDSTVSLFQELAPEFDPSAS